MAVLTAVDKSSVAFREGSPPPEVVRTTTPPPGVVHAITLQTKMGRVPTYLSPQRVKVLHRPIPDSPSKMAYPQKRPEWWDSVHRSLKRMSEVNQKQPISQVEMQGVQDVARGLILQRNPKDLLMFLKLLSSFVVYDTKDIFFEVLKALRILKPELNALFWDLTGINPIEGPSLTPLAMNELFRSYEERFQFQPGILSCQPLTQLPRLVDEFIGRPETGGPHMQGWAIYDDVIPQDGHIVPVFMIRHHNKNHLFIFDSLGHCLFSKDADRKMMSYSLRNLIEHFKTRDDAGARSLTIYSYKTQRQRSDVGCATFASVDLKHLYERHANPTVQHIVDFYQSQTGEFEPSIAKLGTKCAKIYEVFNLPPEMMKLTQSYSTIQSFQESPPILSPSTAPAVQRFTPSDQEMKLQDYASFSSTVSSSKRVGPDARTRNVYIERKRFNDIVDLVTRYFDQHQVHEESAPGPAPQERVDTARSLTPPALVDTVSSVPHVLNFEQLGYK